MELTTQDMELRHLNGSTLTPVSLIYTESGVMLSCQLSNGAFRPLFPDELTAIGVFHVHDGFDRDEEYCTFREALITAISWIGDDYEYSTRYVISPCDDDDCVLFFENVTADRTPDASVLGLEYDGSPVGIKLLRQADPTPQQLLTRCRYCGTTENWIEQTYECLGYASVSITFSEDGGVSEFDISGMNTPVEVCSESEVRCWKCLSTLDSDQLAAFSSMRS